MKRYTEQRIRLSSMRLKFERLKLGKIGIGR